MVFLVFVVCVFIGTVIGLPVARFVQAFIDTANETSFKRSNGRSVANGDQAIY